ncbi:MAG: GNAT family N-acetyltransferase [Deltaproteobacteria bacterium]|nr:GNAT family N-acetyltransferase [Deltaproteobacteria bacterium]
MITLRPIKQSDIIAITCWPSYRGDHEQMDYALRENGWLEEFSRKAGTWCYLAEANQESIGFTILSTTGKKEAEVRIAVHPARTGQGFGKEIMSAILNLGFSQLKLDLIHLIVRKNNFPAIGLYKKLGFKIIGECTQIIQGRLIEFFTMDIPKPEFQNQTNRGDR